MGFGSQRIGVFALGGRTCSTGAAAGTFFCGVATCCTDSLSAWTCAKTLLNFSPWDEERDDEIEDETSLEDFEDAASSRRPSGSTGLRPPSLSNFGRKCSETTASKLTMHQRQRTVLAHTPAIHTYTSLYVAKKCWFLST